MSTSPVQPAPAAILANITAALEEDVGSGDITAALLDDALLGEATLITREAGVICGRPWVDAVFHALDERIALTWKVDDGDRVAPGDELLELGGPVRAMLTGERTALNFLQTLSGTATRCQAYAELVAGTGVKLLDTRKTLPGLREAQKYAVRCGGCFNHRMGLYDAFLIKENHILAAGGVNAAVLRARESSPGKPIEVEVENLDELQQAVDAGCDRVMLDNFSLDAMCESVRLAGGRVELEASGNVTDDNLRDIAATGVDFVSIGALTKDCRALDLSLRLG